MRKKSLSLVGLAAALVMLVVAILLVPRFSVHAASPSISTGYPQLNVTYHGGPVMAGTTHVYAIFWEPTGNVSANYNNLITRFLGDFGNSPLYKVVSQYKQANGAFPTDAVLAGTWVDSGTAYLSPLQDSAIQSEIVHAQQVNGWTSGMNNLFLVFTERNQSICNPALGCATMDCGYHYVAGTTIYAALPYDASYCGTLASPNGDDADSTILALPRVILGAVTNPSLNAWYYYSGFEVEIGNTCEGAFGPTDSRGDDVVWNNNGYLVERVWDNKTGSCVLPLGTSLPIYYKIENLKSKLVLDVSGGSTSAGAKIVQEGDRDSVSQEWKVVPDGPYYKIENRRSKLVLGISGGSTQAGASVIQATSQNLENQRWNIRPDGGYEVIWNVKSGLVLDVRGESTSVGASITQTSGFNPFSSSQQWSLVPVLPTYEIKNMRSGLALDISGGVKTVGAAVIQWPYHGGFSQEWTVRWNEGAYTIVNLNSGLALTIFQNSTKPGAHIVQWTGGYSGNQLWGTFPDGSSGGNPVYRIVNADDELELTVSGASKTQGANIIQSTDHNGLSQQWEFIPTTAYPPVMQFD